MVGGKYAEIADFLKKCLQGENTVESTLESIWPYEKYKDELIDEILHFFRHIYDDEDIRGEDIEYAQNQNQQLQNYIVALQEKSQNPNTSPDMDSQKAES